MDANPIIALLLVSFAINLLLVFVIFRKKSQSLGKEAQALHRIIKKFERERTVTLHIQAIDDENIFLRNPSR